MCMCIVRTSDSHSTQPLSQNQSATNFPLRIIIIFIINMGILVDSVYAVNIAGIRTYKWFELLLLKLFSGPLRRKMISEAEKLGIVFHLPGQLNTDISKEEENRILQKSGWPSIVRVKINDNSVFPQIANKGALGLGEGYINEQWEIVGGDDEKIRAHVPSYGKQRL